MNFDITVLGSNSALPTAQRFSSCHILNVRNKLFMVDCGEGTQIQLRKYKISFAKINHIFISHLHGDHVFGLPGMISSFDLLGRDHDVHIYAHADLKRIMDPYFAFFARQLNFKIVYHDINPSKHALVYNDRSLEVWTLPLNHSTPTCGFLFKEKPVSPNIRRDMVDFYKLGIKDIKLVKEGKDFVTPDGEIVANSRLTTQLHVPRSYAYCSDTAYAPLLPQLIKGIDLLYHEATFGLDLEKRAVQTKHSTTADAARVATEAGVKQLMIGHFSARYNKPETLLIETKQGFENTILAEDGLTLKL